MRWYFINNSLSSDVNIHLNDRVADTVLASSGLSDVCCPLGGRLVIHSPYLDLDIHLLDDQKQLIVTDLRPVERVIGERLPDGDPAWLVLEADSLVGMSSGPLSPQPVVGVALGAPASATAASGDA